MPDDFPRPRAQNLVLLTVDEAAAYVGVTTAVAYQWISAGRWPVIRRDGQVRVMREALVLRTEQLRLAHAAAVAAEMPPVLRGPKDVRPVADLAVVADLAEVLANLEHVARAYVGGRDLQAVQARCTRLRLDVAELAARAQGAVVTAAMAALTEGPDGVTFLLPPVRRLGRRGVVRCRDRRAGADRDDADDAVAAEAAAGRHCDARDDYRP